MKHTPYYSAMRITLVYAGFALLWILFSDMAVEWVSVEPKSVTILQTLKGWMFVVITAAMLFTLSYKSHLRADEIIQIDGLTGLLNHHLFKRKLIGQLARVTPAQRVITVFIDINKFRHFNETAGFEAADRFLRSWADSLKRMCGDNGCVGRFGPDQLVVSIVCNKEEAIESLVASIKNNFKENVSEHHLNLSCSMGVAEFPNDAMEASGLLAAGVNALKQAKKNADSIFYFNKKHALKLESRKALLADLKTAISSKQLSLVYQPKYELQDMRITGVEVLTRWNHPIRGNVPPNEFIPLAESNGLSHALTRFVVETSALELKHVILNRGIPLEVAINVSADEFKNYNFMLDLKYMLNDFPTNNSAVKLEITETATLFDMKKSADIINELRSSGIRFSIDDFGTGYTSLAMLKDLTIDEIKIDKSFVQELSSTEGNAHTIVNAIVAMAKSFGINVVAEGVETAEQLELLKQIGSTQAQGYLLARPMALDELRNHLEMN